PRTRTTTSSCSVRKARERLLSQGTGTFSRPPAGPASRSSKLATSSSWWATRDRERAYPTGAKSSGYLLISLVHLASNRVRFGPRPHRGIRHDKKLVARRPVARQRGQALDDRHDVPGEGVRV